DGRVGPPATSRDGCRGRGGGRLRHHHGSRRATGGPSTRLTDKGRRCHPADTSPAALPGDPFTARTGSLRHASGTVRPPHWSLKRWVPEPGVVRPKLNVCAPRSIAWRISSQYRSMLGASRFHARSDDAHVISNSPR